MCSKISTQKSIETYSGKIERLSIALADADAIIIGAGAGLSVSAGFDKKWLFYTQGDYGLFQCSGPCRQETFENESIVKAMMERQRDMRVPSSLIPRCPHCGKPLTMNLRSDNRFVEDEGWHACLNLGQTACPAEISKQSICIDADIGSILPEIWRLPLFADL